MHRTRKIGNYNVHATQQKRKREEMEGFAANGLTIQCKRTKAGEQRIDDVLLVKSPVVKKHPQSPEKATIGSLNVVDKIVTKKPKLRGRKKRNTIPLPTQLLVEIFLYAKNLDFPFVCKDLYRRIYGAKNYRLAHPTFPSLRTRVLQLSILDTLDFKAGSRKRTWIIESARGKPDSYLHDALKSAPWSVLKFVSAEPSAQLFNSVIARRILGRACRQGQSLGGIKTFGAHQLDRILSLKPPRNQGALTVKIPDSLMANTKSQELALARKSVFKVL